MHLSYVEIWKGIDQLAYTKKMSLSAMAQKAGLDPTAFNKSKRVGPDGRKRWLSMESLNKVLNATNTTLDEFIRLTGQNIEPSRQTIPLLGFAQAGCDGFRDKFFTLAYEKPGFVPEFFLRKRTYAFYFVFGNTHRCNIVISAKIVYFCIILNSIPYGKP